ncbi:Ldh family oxidoreductase [Bhargavaea ginsengi]|uniref:Ldh family oxidoreductase n=1 Tax=Bhargavaea ginsengi TaxID=426757 RepID=UPI00203E2E71|nr:Ldh family oxidoreductase [Bhargavaea ginsengi]MCM3088620.1 Ldh family oxidoreductase [Bhargavaea ginsengi]
MEELRVPKDRLSEFVKNVFLAAGLDEKDSGIISRHLVLASLRGIDSHGVSRTGIYTKRISLGLTNKTFEPEIERETPSSALINGKTASGILNATEAIRLAVEKAKVTGIAVVGVKNSNHCGMLADYTMYAAEQGCIALATTAAPPNMAPWGGKERFFGTNPFAYGIPAGDGKDIIFDMATSVVARGKIILAEKNHQKIPLGWAISADGEPTTDPTEALDGLVLPVGGPKGYGIALMVDLLSSLFTGASFGPHITDLYKDFDHKQNVGHTFIVMRADLFRPQEEFEAEVQKLIREVKNIERMPGVEEIYLPGEIEANRAKEREENGIPLSKDVIEELESIGKEYGVTDLLSEEYIG